MTYDEDLDLANRLRRIAADPEPAVPGSLYRFADQVADPKSRNERRLGRATTNAARSNRRTSVRPPVRVLAGIAAALVVVTLAGTVLVEVKTNSGPASSAAATITDSPTPTLVMTPGTPRPSATSWSGVFDLSKLPGGPVDASSVTRWKGGYVALRSTTDPSGRLSGWMSPDGKAWTQLPEGTFGDARLGKSAQAADQVVVAAGGGESNVWVSSDGMTWTKNTSGNTPSCNFAMAGNSLGMVAIYPDPQYQLVFGPDWRTVVIPGAGFDSIQDVAASGNTFVAVGGRAAGFYGPPAAWWSTDGTTWTKASMTGKPGNGHLTVAAGRDGFAATDSVSSAYWWSADGKTWNQATGPWAPDVHLIGNGEHVVATSFGPGGGTEFWTSVDGKNWTALKLSPTAAAELSPLLSLPPFAGVGAWPVGDGVLFVGHDASWYGQPAAK